MTAAGALADRAAKVPAATLGFCAIKIIATALGDTGGDNSQRLLGTALGGYSRPAASLLGATG